MGKIAILPPELVNQIAAGEVVERPASVVKELVENAMDAGATRIDVQVKNGGRSLRVADNGCGMTAEDLQLAFRNHATSKVKTIDDLFQIQTLGFRGEALASIAAIARVTCSSRPPEASVGLKATVQPNGEVTLQETGCAPGTIFEIADLFYNVPARLKFLKRPQTELSHIQECLQLLALSHPEIAIQLTLESSQALKTSGSGRLEKCLAEVFSLNPSEIMLSFEATDMDLGYRVWGMTSPPDVTRGTKKWLATFVNGRAVKCPMLAKAIESAYQAMIVPGKFPITALFLELPPDEVDVNVHPTKKEVKYQRANTMFSFVRGALEAALGQVGLAPVFQGNTGRSNGLVTTPRETARPITGSVTRPSYREAAATAKPVYPSRLAPTHTQAALDLYRTPSRPQVEPRVSTIDAASLSPELTAADAFQVIGQLACTYILIETAEGLLVVDQHIASERVMFELFSAQAEQIAPASQPLLIPITLPVSPLQAAGLVENRVAFEALGFVFELSEQSTVAFTTVPSLYNSTVLKNCLQQLLLSLEETGQIKLNVTDVIATMACHSAVRAGDFLTLDQMRQVIAQWVNCQRPWTCPHGRPVSHLILHTELMQYFERPSLPQTRREFAPL